MRKKEPGVRWIGPDLVELRGLGVAGQADAGVVERNVDALVHGDHLLYDLERDQM